MKLDQAPKVLDFFLVFLIRNNVLPELKPKLLMAQTIVELAKSELPATASIGYNIPCDFAKACRVTWNAQEGLFDQFACRLSRVLPEFVRVVLAKCYIDIDAGMNSEKIKCKILSGRSVLALVRQHCEKELTNVFGEESLILAKTYIPLTR